MLLGSNKENEELDLIIMGIELIVFIIYCTTIQSLHGLSYFSYVANFLNFAGLIFVLYYVVQGSPPQSERPAFVGWFDMPMYFGTAVYAFEGIGLVSTYVLGYKHCRSNNILLKKKSHKESLLHSLIHFCNNWILVINCRKNFLGLFFFYNAHW